MKKGQVQQIFIWIFILILAVTILTFGIKTIKQGENLKDEVLLVSFFQSLEKKIDYYYYLDMGSSGTEELILPNGVTEICFVNLNKNTGDPYLDSLNAYSNVFVRPETEFKENRFKIVLNEETNEPIFFVGSGVNSADKVCPTANGGRVRIKFLNDGRTGVKILAP